MQKAFLAFLKKHQLYQPDARYLLAVSGGVDSVVMAALFHQTGLSFSIAHVNFKLRGAGSDEDQHFVEKLGDKYDVQIFSTEVDTKAEAAKVGQSIQLFAREFRYKWLASLKKQHDFTFICTAHHADDALETILYNLTKGTGIAGLVGVPLQRGHIIRPLLFATKQDLLGFAASSKLEYQTDISNQDSKYDRNKIRLAVIPKLQEINPALSRTSIKTVENLRGSLKIYQAAINEYRRKLWDQTNKNIHSINIDALLKTVAPKDILFELLSPYGINPYQLDQIYTCIEVGTSGKVFHTLHWTILRDRSEIQVSPRTNEQRVEVHISRETKTYSLPEGQLQIEIKGEGPSQFSSDPKEQWLDLNNLKFPLVLRRWKSGDYFHPMGMDGHRKKLQDYFSDRKLSRFEKQSIWILESDRHIVSLIGYHIDESYKLAPESTEFLHITYLPNLEKN